MKYFPLLAALTCLFSGCVKNNPEPAYLTIHAWAIEENPDAEEDAGYLTHNFTDDWVYADGKLAGVFELPCKIPLFLKGTTQITVYPAIRNNGISATKKIYPFCESYKTTINVSEGGSYDLHPVTRYVSNCSFWLEDFSDNNLQLENVDTSSSAILRENTPGIALSGYYGHVIVNANNPLWHIATTPMVLPHGKDVYLEIDYRTTTGFRTGLLSYTDNVLSATNENIGVRAQNASELSWKKVYIDLKELVTYNVSAQSFRHYFFYAVSGNNGPGEIFIDNIRIVSS